MRKGEYYSHDLLEMAAYGILGLQRTKENEEKVLNLHNHLIWNCLLYTSDAADE